MKIAIDARMLFWTGVGRYTKALLDELQRLDNQNEYVVLMRKADFDLWSPTSGNFKRIEANFDPYTIDEQWSFYWLLRRLNLDVVHFTTPNTPLLYRGRRIVSIHDLTLLDYDTSRGAGLAKLLRQAKRLPFRMVFWNNARFADHMITPTNYVRGQLIDRFSVPPQRVTTVSAAADASLAEPSPIDRLGELGRYLFYVGNFYPYKNVASTIRALTGLNRDVKLILAGKPDTYVEDLKRLVRELGLMERVVFAGRVSDGELVSLYRSAAAYVNPSLSEGFGLQGLEAMAQGVPVVSARASCLPEVYGEAAEYFDPNNARDQAAALRRVIEDPQRSEELRRAGAERFKQYSWQRTAKETLAVYKKMV